MNTTLLQAGSWLLVLLAAGGYIGMYLNDWAARRGYNEGMTRVRIWQVTGRWITPRF
jgi:hypothetical protein